MNSSQPHEREPVDARMRMTTVIFGTDTPAGRNFDLALIVCILLSVAVVVLGSVEPIQARYGAVLAGLEWAFTVLFTIEYAARLWSAPNTFAYAASFFGIVDLLAILPTYFSAVLPGAGILVVVRALRLLRVFRILKLLKYLRAADLLLTALKASRQKIAVFVFTVLILVLIFGSCMYAVEGADNGFTSIPRSIYWAVVTLTTVGYGDISPQTTLGQALATIIMIMGYGIIAVPTGLVSVELARGEHGGPPRRCPSCTADIRDREARHCKYCGTQLPPFKGEEEGSGP
ncbi:MAG: ion transporter [Chitinivibrionales bacterium]|nr:ion transporter [Chitinivibrionales bacterium]